MAVNRALKAGRFDETGIDSPLIELLRTLARQMDAAVEADEDGPSQRLEQAYLAALRTLTHPSRRRLYGVGAGERPEEEDETEKAPLEPPQLTVVGESALDRIRRKKNRAR